MTYFSKHVNTTVPDNAKWTFTTRRVDHADVAGLTPVTEDAVAGDLILAEITEVNQHKKTQLANGRYAASYKGDLVVLALGDRYAPDQFMGCAEMRHDALDLLAGGGVCGVVEAKHAKMSSPTQLRPLGMVADKAGKTLNIADYAIDDAIIPEHVTVIGVFGASMNAGKTTAAVSIAHGLSKAGFKVAGVKATGTGAFGDFNAFRDAGIPVTDFTDAGMATTYRIPLAQIERGFQALVGQAAENGAEIVVVEIADGVFQSETAAILRNSSVVERMDGMLFAVGDALGAVGGVTTLARYGHRPFALTGKLSLSALGTREAETETNLPVLSREALCDGDTAADLIAPMMRAKTRQAA